MQSRIVRVVLALAVTGVGAVAHAAEDQPLDSDPARVGYSFGIMLGESLRERGVELDLPALYEGIGDAYGGDDYRIDRAEANRILQEADRDRRSVELAANQKRADDFLRENGLRDAVTSTATGLQYEVLEQGDGPKPGAEDRVQVHYRGQLINGAEFDSSYKRGEPATFGVNQVIAGWTEALQLMPVGSRWKLYVPPDLAYGERGAGRAIGPNEALIFEVELLEIIE